LLGDPEVERDRLWVADVEVSVRLGREAGHDVRDPAFAHVGGDDLADEIASFGTAAHEWLGQSRGAWAARDRRADPCRPGELRLEVERPAGNGQKHRPTRTVRDREPVADDAPVLRDEALEQLEPLSRAGKLTF